MKKKTFGLAIDKYQVRTSRYKNAISHKLPNRRVTVIENSVGGFGFEFKSIDYDYTPHAICRCDKGKVAVTYINISVEAAELIMLSIAELIGVEVIRKVIK